MGLRGMGKKLASWNSEWLIGIMIGSAIIIVLLMWTNVLDSLISGWLLRMFVYIGAGLLFAGSCYGIIKQWSNPPGASQQQFAPQQFAPPQQFVPQFAPQFSPPPQFPQQQFQQSQFLSQRPLEYNRQQFQKPIRQPEQSKQQLNYGVSPSEFFPSNTSTPQPPESPVEQELRKRKENEYGPVNDGSNFY